MEVNRVGIHAVVRDLPDLSAIRGGGNRGHIKAVCIGSAENLCRRTDIGIQNYILQERRGAGRFEAEVGGHASKLIEAGRVHFIVNGLRFKTDLQLRTIPIFRWAKRIKLEGRAKCIRGSAN